ncbi:hypothetical protein KIV66_gp64 [Mycobacterium phage MyraDee]|uniref:Uncharacterized protein n=1 Tax=Mycobacterium phage MyraDee TaxID=2024303 RepID=A0A222YY11_9CAUD|nr:hypothetical protein KIV66_gp64 [Mycobacterium phage MyraDee]ASR77171.1 hypothetical protein SEA_MYRADEE_64 [Mycobacterium phage MyraDee]
MTSNGENNMSPKPAAKANRFHQVIMTALLANKSSTPLAQNVSELSIQRAAKRWFN